MKTTTNNDNWWETMPEEWKVRFVGDDGEEQEIALRDHPSLRKYGSKDEAVKALVHAQRMLGRRPEGYMPVPDQNDPERMAEVYAALGRPETPDGYELTLGELPEGLERDEALMGAFRQKAHELGLSPAQVSGLYGWFEPLVLDIHDQQQRDGEQSRLAELEGLRAVHRGETPQILAKALRAAEAIGGDELLDALDSTGAGNHAAVISAFARMAPLVLEGGLRGSSPGFGKNLTKARLREMMKDPRYHDPLQRDEEYVRTIQDGFKALYPGQYAPHGRG